MSPDPTHPDPGPHGKDPTRTRLIEAAGEVFAEVGFRDATIRDICARAGANVAAVNYHFGDKERLYAEVIEHAYCSADHRYVDELKVSTLNAEEKLGIFIRGFLAKLIVTGRPNWHIKLISREMIEPSGQMDVIVDRYIRPQFELLCGIIVEVLGVGPEDEGVCFCAASVIGQCLHYHHTREVGQRLYPGMYDHPEILNEISGHITRFTLHALKGLREDRRRGGRP